MNIYIFFLDPEFAVEPVSESGPTGGPESVDIVDVDSDNDDDYLVEDDPSPSKLQLILMIISFSDNYYN